MIQEGEGFGTWVNDAKDASYSSVSANLNKDTVLVLGSSEFEEGRSTPYHPTKIFRNLGIDMMFIGSADTYCLANAICLGAVGENIRGGKLVVILSPGWFLGEGYTPERFSHRYSESEFIALLKSNSLPQEIKDRISDRVLTLLAKDPKGFMAQRYVNCYGKGKGGPMKWLCDLRFAYLNDKERTGVYALWKATGQGHYREDMANADGKEPDWDALAKQGAKEHEKVSQSNPYHMEDSIYESYISTIEEQKKDSLRNLYFEEDCPEFDDLRLLLDIAAVYDLDVELILQPMNGPWYDYNGFTKDHRDGLPKILREIIRDYPKVHMTALYGEYEENHYLKNWNHPNGEGWTAICRTIYDFVK